MQKLKFNYRKFEIKNGKSKAKTDFYFAFSVSLQISQKKTLTNIEIQFVPKFEI
jgi:hypothetical protein